MTTEQLSELTDEQVDAYIADPATIDSHDTALVVLDCLDTEIAAIQAQVDAAQIEAGVRALSPEKTAWLHRASYACAMRRNERHRVMQRDKEIRGTKGRAFTPPIKDKEANALKQQRLLEETQVRRAAKQLEVEKQKTAQMELARRRQDMQAKLSADHRFVAVARRLLPDDLYGQIAAEAGLTVPKPLPSPPGAG